MTLTSILTPHWYTFSVRLPDRPTATPITTSIGLHRSCSSLATPACRPFPTRADCAGDDAPGFCAMWRSTGFLMTLAAVLEVATLVGIVVVLAGGKHRRVAGWSIPSAMLLGVGAVEGAAMAVAVSFPSIGGSGGFCWMPRCPFAGTWRGELRADGLCSQAYLFDNDDMFLVPGWRLDSSWVLCTVSAAASVLCALGLAASAYLLPPERGYTLLRDPSGA
jgi:hypothetical protein